MDLKPCRDCGKPVEYVARSCPYCGIMNPVAKWVALPDGEDERFRVPVTRPVETPAPAYAAAPAYPSVAVAAAPGYPSAVSAGPGYPPRAPEMPAGTGPAYPPRRPEMPGGAPDPLADARKQVRTGVVVFYAMALINAAVSFWLGPVGLVTAAVLAGLATWLLKRNSTMAAAMMLLVALLNVYFVGKSAQPTGIWMAILIVLAAWRALNGAMQINDGRVSTA